MSSIINMASVSSLDKDLRRLRLDKYTPTAVNEAKEWIESILGERLQGDLLDALKDGTVLCRLVNLAIPPPGVKFKKSPMPFVQMESISQFLAACQLPPLSLLQHDMFLTVDLYEQKDPAQVLQCLGAFSRAAHRLNPAVFPSSIGPRASSKTLTPQTTGGTTLAKPAPVNSPFLGREPSSASNASSLIGRAATPSLFRQMTGSSNSGRISPIKSPTRSPTRDSTASAVANWNRKNSDTSPAWNIAQYGSISGVSQGSMGVSFGGRRQITSAGPYVPNTADKERRRKEAAAEVERQRLEEEKRRAELEAEEERERLEEERLWEAETRRLREEERRQAEEEKRRWEEQERQWKLTEEKRRQEEADAEARLTQERQSYRLSTAVNNDMLRGQFLSQYQADLAGATKSSAGDENPEEMSNRIKQLELELEKARQREAEYERERRERSCALSARLNGSTESRARSRSRPPPQSPSRQESWRAKDDQGYISPQPPARATPVNEPSAFEFTSPRPLPKPTPRAAAAPLPAAKPPQLQQTPPKSRSVADLDPPSQGAPPPVSPRLLPSTPTPTPASLAMIKTHRTGGATSSTPAFQGPVREHKTGSRPLPDPAAYAAASSSTTLSPRPGPKPATASATTPSSAIASRTSRLFHSSSPAPSPSPQPPILSSPPSQPPAFTYANNPPRPDSRPAVTEASQTPRRPPPPSASTTPIPAPSLAGKSLLEREMELERQRQREWEEAQRETAKAVPTGDSVDGIGGRYDVSQWTGYTSGDNMNRGSQGIGANRRQIVGPRPLPGGRP